MTQLPQYCKTILNLSVERTSIVSALPYITEWIFAMLSGIASDILLKKKVCSLTIIRKIFIIASLWGTGVFLMIGVYLQCHKIAVIVCLCICMGFLGVYYSAAWINYSDVAPTFSGTLTSLSNTCGAVQGFIATSLVAGINPNFSFMGWVIVFWITTAICGVTGLVYLFLGTAVRQQWDIDAAEAAQAEHDVDVAEGKVSKKMNI